MTLSAHSRAENSVRLLLTSNPARSFSYPRCQVNGISFERFRRLCQTVGPISGPFDSADLSFTLLKRWRPLPQLRCLCCTVTSDEQTRPGNEPRHSVHGVNPRVPLDLESHFGPIRHEWLYRIAPKITETLKRRTTTTTWGYSRHGRIST